MMMKFWLLILGLVFTGQIWATPLSCAGTYPNCDLNGDSSVDLTTASFTTVPAGVVTYLDGGSAFPIPQQSGGPAALDVFAFGDTVRAGELFDISNLTESALIGSLLNWGAASSPSRLVWTLLWNSPSTMGDPATSKHRNDVTVLWDDPSSTNDIVGLQAAGSNLALASDPLLLDERGAWQVDSYVNGVFIHGWRFTVPEPGSLWLLGVGLAGLLRRRAARL